LPCKPCRGTILLENSTVSIYTYKHGYTVKQNGSEIPSMRAIWKTMSNKLPRNKQTIHPVVYKEVQLVRGESSIVLNPVE